MEQSFELWDLGYTDEYLTKNAAMQPRNATSESLPTSNGPLPETPFAECTI